MTGRDTVQHLSTEERAVVAKAMWRLLPFLCVTYFIAYLDRVNVGFAALTMNQNLALSATVFGNGAGISSWRTSCRSAEQLVIAGSLATAATLSYVVGRRVSATVPAGALP